MGDDIRAKIERSSLGTAEAVAARASVSDATAARVVARANLLGGIDAILRDHVIHAGASGPKWWAECLSVDCGWSGHGDGSIVAAKDEHRDHLTSVLADVVNPPARPATPIERVSDQYVAGLQFGADLARAEARWQEEQHRRGVPNAEYARDRALQLEQALRSVAGLVST